MGWAQPPVRRIAVMGTRPVLLVRSVKQLLLWRWDASIPPMPVIPVARASRMPLSGFILYALFWVLVCPFDGEGEVVCDGVAEIAGDLSDEPSVGKIAFTHWIGRRSLHPAIRVGDLLWVRCRASFANCEVDRVTGRRNPLPRTWVWTVCVPWLYCREVCRGSARLRGESAPPPGTATSNISRTVPMAHAYNALSVRKRLFKLHRNPANSPILIMLSGKQEHATHLKEHMNAMRPHLLLFAGERGLLFKPSSGDQPVFWRPAATPETVQRIR